MLEIPSFIFFGDYIMGWLLKTRFVHYIMQQFLNTIDYTTDCIKQMATWAGLAVFALGYYGPPV